MAVALRAAVGFLQGPDDLLLGVLLRLHAASTDSVEVAAEVAGFGGQVSWAKEREAILVDGENEMLRAARDRARTDEERACWDEFLKLRKRNLDAQR